MFLSKPILQTLSKHLSFVLKVEIDWNEEILDLPPFGAIAMATAAVSTSVCLLLVYVTTYSHCKGLSRIRLAIS